MNVLIVEDDANKSRQLAELVRGLYPSAAVVERRSYQSGLKEAMSNGPDIVLLDMTMPTYDVGGSETGGRTRAFGGKDILRRLQRRKIRTRVIVVTQFESFVGDDEGEMTLDELKAVLERDFPENYVGIVFYQPSETQWRDRLIAALREASVVEDKQ